MRASLSNLIQALHAQEPPRRIWQQPFDYNPGHYKGRLMAAEARLFCGGRQDTFMSEDGAQRTPRFYKRR